jgi:uncharacterized membrane protein YdjX (TVP38/TMEM64 family)
MNQTHIQDEPSSGLDPAEARLNNPITSPAEIGTAWRARRLWLALGALLLAALAASHFGAFWYLGNASRLRNLVLAMGPAGPVLFIVMFTAFEAFGLPGVVFVGAAPLVWPLWLAIVFSWAGGVGAALLGFFFARTIGRDWVRRRMPPRFRRYDEHLSGRGMLSVLVARLLFFMAPPVHWMFGLSSVGWPVYLAGTAIGLLPGIVLVSFSGKSLFGYLTTQPPPVWIAAALIIGAVLFTVRRLRQAPAA